jgi:hypothetical protein
MSKLTPKQAFEHLKAMFPWLHEIVKDSSSTVLIDKCGQKVEPLSANIEWGDATSYKPDVWRPATKDDARRVFYGQVVYARCCGDSETDLKVIGFICKADGFFLVLSDFRLLRLSDVEVRE